jgi:hypothetical protein
LQVNEIPVHLHGNWCSGRNFPGASKVADKRINQYAREPEISIYVLKGAKVDVIKRIKEEADRKKNFGKE